MHRRIGRLIQVGIFAALPAGAAFAQSGTGGNMPNTGGITDHVGGQGSQRATGLAGTTNDTPDTTTKAQQKANKLDEQTPAVPGDSTRPGEVPATPKSDTDTGIRGDTGSSTGATTPGSGATDTDMNKLNTDESSSTMEKKTTKHKRTHRSSDTGDVDRPPGSSVEQKSNLKLENDDTMNRQIQEKNDLNKDQLNSDK